MHRVGRLVEVNPTTNKIAVAEEPLCKRHACRFC